ncbi:ACP S-malonyltransferase [Psychromicrobium xiongbiense]|uniref:ACP S-malonyltransferase n=1 Tax=Psychromicrobium xiongbiense TaxID=3051184 RepID=UPI0025549A04|nr:ACP S-malonyltransferase [Psychromicrobium sp. YIM S02556]
MIAIVCPGQGAQTPGFLQPWLELPGVEEHLAELGELAGLDLVRHGTTSDAETIKDTAVAQPLIVAAGLISAAALFGSAKLPAAVGVVAGHSVGEITAAALTGVLSEEEAMRFVRERANGMAAAAALTPTGMSAVVGGDPDEVLAAISATGLTPANLNSPGQTVAAGTLDQLAALAANPPAKARVIALQVAGAFHTLHMQPAVGALEILAPALHPHEPAATLLSNYDGAAVASGEAALQSLVAQVSRPVRWDACMRTMTGLGVTTLIELSPAGTLTGLAKRAMPGVTTLAVKTPADLDAARTLLEPGTAPADGQASE